MDILTSCFAIIGSLCIQGSAEAKILYGTGWSGAIIREKNGVSISSMTGSDAEVTPYKPKMHRLCKNNECVLYKASCTDLEQTMTCTIWYSYHLSMPLRKIEIAGETRHVRSAIGHLKLVRSRRLIVPLARFRYDGADALPPACQSRSGCETSKE